MPSLEQLLLSPPAGFVASCLEINNLASSDENKLRGVVQEAWKDVQANSSLCERGNESLSNTKKGVTYIIRAMRSAHPAPSISVTAKALVASTLLTQQSVELILLQVKELSKSSDPEIMTVTKVVKYSFSFFPPFILITAQL